MAYRFGIDAGSKTIKLVVIDDSGKMVHSLYHRHRSDIRTTLAEVLHELTWRYGDMEGTVGITGSAGIGLAEMLHLPFIQEVVATTHAVQSAFPQADAFIELGGEDAKVVYLTGGLEQRMNATCAGGTGGFIDTIAFMIGSRAKEMSALALGANRIYPIASRCAVFAQTDIRPLLNAGAKPSDIAASTLEAVVRQTLGGLACGRPITGNVVFLGGPLEHIPELVRRFRNALGLNHKTGIKPSGAHLFTACGAALLAAEEDAPLVSLAQLEQLVKQMSDPDNDLPRLPRLFDNAEEYASFRKRHAQARMPRRALFAAKGPLYVGIDAGSTTVKLVALNEHDEIAYSDYQPTKGDALKTAASMLEKFYTALPRNTRHEPYATIEHATVTGYGEELLKAGLGVDSGVVETLAHVRAAQAFQPNLTFLLDVGGQDMKAIWVRDGRVVNAVLNEACSSGCGSFIEGTAYSLRSTPHRFAEEALTAENPADLGTKCTVFMTSRVRHAQKIGVPHADIAAGIAYSVVKNALFRIIGMNKLDSLGDCVVVQGGAFMSDAVLRAFEKVSGREVIRPDAAHLMGAIGAALTAHMRADAQTEPRSTLIGQAELKALAPKRTALHCPGCQNNCMLSLVDFGNGRHFISGNKCERAASFVKDPRKPLLGASLAGNLPQSVESAGAAATGAAAASAVSPDATSAASATPTGASASTSAPASTPPNVIKLQQKLLARFGNTEGTGPRAEAYLGLLNVLSLYDQTPFWHTLLTHLGFSIIMPNDDQAVKNGAEREGAGTIPSESVCYPAKISHRRLYDLMKSGVSGIFMPHFQRGSACPVLCEYPLALADAVPALRNGDCLLVSPRFSSLKLSSLSESKNALLNSLNEFAEHAGVSPVTLDELDSAIDAGLRAQHDFEQTVRSANERALTWTHKISSRRAAVLAGRPYHVDPALLHRIDDELTHLGFAVLSPLSLPISTPCEKLAWAPAKHLAKIATGVSAHPKLELVCLQSFGCGFDALSLPFVRDILDGSGHPFTALKIDDMADTAHLRIRLRTLAETLELEDHQAQSCHAAKPMNTKEATDPSAALAHNVRVLGSIESDDLNEAQSSVNSDACFVVKALAGRAIRLIKENPEIEALEVPAVCERCLVDALPDLVERATERTPHIIWTKEWPACETSFPEKESLSAPDPNSAASPDPAAPAPESAAIAPIAAGFNEPASSDPKANAAALTNPNARDRKPLIGILGCALLCFDETMNDDIVRFINSQGCQAVLPRSQSLFAEDVRYLDELARFADLGVDHVIYLQSFGCLKGHVRARGALHELARRFPNMPITVLDYDPEASALNRENRIRLALSAAKNAKGQRENVG